MLAGVEEGTGRPICICFYSISTPSTLTLSGKSLLDSLPGTARGEEAGSEWKVSAHDASLSLGEASTSPLLPAQCRPRGQGPSGNRRLLWPVRSGEFWAGCSRSAPASPGEVLVRRWVPASCLYSPQPRQEIPRPFICCPTTLLAFQVCAG